MKPFFRLFAAAALAAGAAFGAQAAAPLLTPAELNDLRTSPTVRIVDIRSAADYSANHIPGAVSAPYAQWRGPADSPGQLPPTDKLADLVRNLGIDKNVHTVVVSTGADQTDFGAAARVYWTLKYLGLSELSILNGGAKAWADAGLPQDQAVPSVAATGFQPALNTSLIATQEHVRAQIDNPRVQLVDARPSNFFRGEVKAPTAKVPGTIRSALNLEHSKWFKPGTAIFVSAEEAKAIAAQSLPDPADETISFCNTGHWAATDWFALSEVVGQKNVTLYPASLAEWTQAPEALPMDNVPSRGQQILKSLKDLVS